MTAPFPIPVFADTKKQLLTTTQTVNLWEAGGRRGQICSSTAQVIGDGKVGHLSASYINAAGTRMFTLTAPMLGNEQGNALLGWNNEEVSDWPAHCLRPIDMSGVVEWVLSTIAKTKPLTTAIIGLHNIHARTILEWEWVVKRICAMSLDRRLDSAAYGVEWAIKTGRASTAAVKAIEGLSAYQFCKLLVEVANLGMTQNDVPRWLNEKF